MHCNTKVMITLALVAIKIYNQNGNYKNGSNLPLKIALVAIQN